MNTIKSLKLSFSKDLSRCKSLGFIVFSSVLLCLTLTSLEAPGLAQKTRISQNPTQSQEAQEGQKELPAKTPENNSADTLLENGEKSLTIQNQPSPSGLIPAGSGIVAKTLAQIVTDPERKFAIPVTMVTILPIYDSNGNPIIPASTLLNGRIEKRQGGDEVIIESLLYKGRVIDLETIGKLMPAQMKTENIGQFITPPKSKLSTVFEAFRDSSFTGILLSVALSDVTDSGRQRVNTLLITSLLADLAFRGLAAVTDRPQKPYPPLVDIPQNSILVFALRKDLVLPEIPAENTPLPSGEGTPAQ